MPEHLSAIKGLRQALALSRAAAASSCPEITHEMDVWIMDGHSLLYPKHISANMGGVKQGTC